MVQNPNNKTRMEATKTMGSNKNNENGSEQPPRVGDLLIYARELNHTGHVAIVIDTDYEDGVIAVAEQNYNNEPWPDDYSRKIELVRREGNYWLLDKHLIGWKHLIQ